MQASDIGLKGNLTDRQSEIYKYIRKTIKTQNCPPTLREIMEEFDISSTNGIRNNLKALHKKGYIDMIPGVSRGIRLRKD